MKTKTLLTISIIANIVLAGLFILKMFQAPTGQVNNEEPVNFDDEFLNEANSQRLTAQNLQSLREELAPTLFQPQLLDNSEFHRQDKQKTL